MMTTYEPPELFSIFWEEDGILFHGDIDETQCDLNGTVVYTINRNEEMHPYFRRIINAVERVLESFAWEDE